MPNIETIDARSASAAGLLRSPLHEVVWISPLDVSFSQNVIYPKFADGHSVDEAVQTIRVAGFRFIPRADGAGEAEKRLVLEPPFPVIEAVRWAPKMRDGQGRPLYDEHGAQRHGALGIFTVDNRRLYALQRAAVAQYPSQCCCQIHVLTDKNEVFRHLKKFRTRTNGLSITVSEWNGIGRDNARGFSAIRVWDWRSAIAKAAEAGEEGSMVAVEAASSGSCGCWEYLDHKDILRGPFSNWQMRQWWEREMFPPDLRIRPYDAALTSDREAPEELGKPFLPVVRVFEDAPSPFAPGFSPRTTDDKVDWKRCGHCGKKHFEGWSSDSDGGWYCVTCWRRWKHRNGYYQATSV